MATAAPTKRAPRKPAPKKPAAAPAPSPTLSAYLLPKERAFGDANGNGAYLHRTIGSNPDWTVDDPSPDDESVGIFNIFQARRRPILLEGPTSTGKTFAIEAYAAARQIPLFTIYGSGGTTESDLYGRWLPSGVGDELTWVDGPVTTWALHGGILYVNEANFIPAEVLSSLYSALDDRRTIEVRGHYIEDEGEHRQRVIPLHEDCWVVVDGNPGYVGTGEWSEALRNRCTVLPWHYDRETEAQLIVSAALLEFVEALRTNAKGGGGIFTPVATKQFVEFERNVYDFGWDFGVEVLVAYFHESERDQVRETLNDGYADRICNDYGIEV